MSLTIDQLEVGGVYVSGKTELVIKYVGSDIVIYEAVDRVAQESSSYIINILGNWSLAPKPKKKIELVTFIDDYGYCIETVKDSENFRNIVGCLHGKNDYKQISSRIIMVENE